MRRWIIFFFLLGCSSISDPYTPDGAHSTVQRLLETGDYRSLHRMVAERGKNDFQEYVDSTRFAAGMIRQFYPDGMKYSALQSLTLPLPLYALRLEDVEADIPPDSLFSIFCRGLLHDDNLKLTYLRSLGLSPTSVDRISDREAVVHTLGNEAVPYRLESDGVWRSEALFGKQFREMAAVSSANLAVIRQNIRVFADSAIAKR